MSCSPACCDIGIYIKGVQVFDPRDGKHKYTENPALIMRDLMCRFGLKGYPDEEICKLADFCDEQVWKMSAMITMGNPNNGRLYAETYTERPAKCTS